MIAMTWTMRLLMVNLTQTQLSELLLVLLLPPHVDFYRLSLRRNPSSHFRHLIELVPIFGQTV